MEFSSHSLRANKGQSRPDVNQEIFKWACSGVPISRIAENVGVTQKTVASKLAWLAKQAERFHEKAIVSGELNTSYIQIDEMETYEHTRLKPLSISIAVRVKTGQIIDMKVATMNCHGPLAALSQKKYGLRKDTRKEANGSVIETVRRVVNTGSGLTVGCDSKSSYPGLIKNVIQGASIQTHLVVKESYEDTVKPTDPLFAINLICAKLRSDLAPLARKTWVTTKSPEKLRQLLSIYIAWNNGYDICSNTNLVDTPVKSKKPKSLKNPQGSM